MFSSLPGTCCEGKAGSVPVFPSREKFKKDFCQLTDLLLDALLYQTYLPSWTGLTFVRIPMQVNSLWRASLIFLLTFLLRSYCHFHQLAGRFRQEQYP